MAETLEKLSNACGVAGREEEVRALVKDMLKPYVDEVKEDKLGNVIGIKKGKKNAAKVMLAAHMDEIGLFVKTISKEGFLQFTKIGGIDDRILLAQKVIVHTEKGPLHGIIGSKPPHIQKEEERKKVMTYDELFIDIGAESQEEAKKMGVKIGDPVSFDIKFARIGNDIVIGKAFDDRVGCAVMIEAIKQLKKTECTVYAVGTVQEEVGLRGATTAAFGIYPDVGIALDVTVAGDVPGVKEVEAPIKLRKGPSIEVADMGLITHPKVLQLLVEAAEENKIPYQLEAGLPGSTDAARISLTREGVPSGVISVPTRYIHSPASLLSLKDAEYSVKLTVASLQKIPKHF
ncbi:MAG: M42 family metallopeptidase [Candidatus Bathyarchaeota archaeon]|nr:M42 family metallopeptidase [Candidatus Bathyarchaeota archaeon A05DMB-3]MDH7607219.1 M42 family metallopeptidase [Candidatus Bathyarchaeota archaeon]